MPETFADQGYALFPELLSKAEVDTLKEAVNRHVSAQPRRHAYEDKDLGALAWHPAVTEIVEGFMGGPYVFHHIHAARHDAGTPGAPWHQDYEQYPQTNRSHLMVHVFFYLNGLNGTVGDLLLVPGSHRSITDRLTLSFLGTSDMPGSITVDDLPPGSALVVHSAMWHGRRAKAGGGENPRYFIDTSYCRSGIKWPSYPAPGMLANLRERHVLAGGTRPWLFDETQFFDASRAQQTMGRLEGSVVLDLPQWQAS